MRNKKKEKTIQILVFLTFSYMIDVIGIKNYIGHTNLLTTLFIGRTTSYMGKFWMRNRVIIKILIGNGIMI